MDGADLEPSPSSSLDRLSAAGGVKSPCVAAEDGVMGTAAPQVTSMESPHGSPARLLRDLPPERPRGRDETSRGGPDRPRSLAEGWHPSPCGGPPFRHSHTIRRGPSSISAFEHCPAETPAIPVGVLPGRRRPGCRPYPAPWSRNGPRSPQPTGSDPARCNARQATSWKESDGGFTRRDDNSLRDSQTGRCVTDVEWMRFLFLAAAGGRRLAFHSTTPPQKPAPQ